MTVVALYNIKGGVGKTTACVNLGYRAAAEGGRVLLVDLDPQGAAGFHLNVKPPEELDARRLLKAGERMRESIRGTDFPNFDVLPADISYRHLPHLLEESKHPKKRFRALFGGFEDSYDFLFVDCPPNLGLEAENVVLAADLVVVPVVPSPLSMRSLDLVVEFFAGGKTDGRLFQAFFSMVDRRKARHRELAERVPAEDPRYLATSIPYSTDVEASAAQRLPVSAIRRQSPAKAAFETLWKELTQRIPG